MGQAQMNSETTADLHEGVRLYNAGAFVDALRVFSNLADAGNAEALMWLGSCYAHGEGVPSSLTAAFEYYRKSAESGFLQAQTNTGTMLIGGQGCVRDIEAGLAWLKRAAASDDVGAQFNLATLLTSGKELEPDFEQAVGLYRRAAEKGHYPSQARLGFCYQQGKGVSKSRVDAYLWFALAAQHGVGTALSALERLSGEMSADEKRQGLALVQSWRMRTLAVSGQAVLNPTSH